MAQYGYGNHRIRKISTAGVVTTLAGSGVSGFMDGTLAMARFNRPAGVAVDASGNVYVADEANHRIRKISPEGVVTTLAGNGTAGFAEGTVLTTQFSSPRNIVVDGLDNLYVADRNNHRVCKISPDGKVIYNSGRWKISRKRWYIGFYGRAGQRGSI